VVLARSDFEIRLASGAGGVRSRVGMLVQRLYAWKGLSISPTAESTRPNEMTLAAYRGAVLFGTLTVGFDSAAGLLVDELYRDEIDKRRAQGARIFEITRLAIDPCFNSKEVLATIFNLAYIYARQIHGMTDAFIEVNPRHVGFYRRMMGFTDVGEERFCQRVCAPARLLHLPMTLMDELVGKFGGKPESGDRSLYAYFFSQEEQAGIVKRLRGDSLIALD
jgi:N-acyl amino acid synthase FeeM